MKARAQGEHTSGPSTGRNHIEKLFAILERQS